MLRYLPFLLVLAVWIYAFIDCLNTPEKEVRNLPKLVWVAIIVLFGSVLFGPLAWFVGGRPRGRPVIAGGEAGAGGGGRRPGRGRWVAPDDNPDFLRSLEEGRRKEERQQRREQSEEREQPEESREEPRKESREQRHEERLKDERGRERDEEGPEGRQGPDEDRR
ncbi:PLD nuclease N-terminal domain-containing protein [Streptomyces sp. 184]|uniref:PLD nuclease N-terminal domain-containing protein n=1 Tax=Streptomyces sp. 184 TaxID=1827526 RepID=UPI0038918B03